MQGKEHLWRHTTFRIKLLVNFHEIMDVLKFNPTFPLLTIVILLENLYFPHKLLALPLLLNNCEKSTHSTSSFYCEIWSIITAFTSTKEDVGIALTKLRFRVLQIKWIDFFIKFQPNLFSKIKGVLLASYGEIKVPVSNVRSLEIHSNRFLYIFTRKGAKKNIISRSPFYFQLVHLRFNKIVGRQNLTAWGKENAVKGKTNMIPIITPFSGKHKTTSLPNLYYKIDPTMWQRERQALQQKNCRCSIFWRERLTHQALTSISKLIFLRKHKQPFG